MFFATTPIPTTFNLLTATGTENANYQLTIRTTTPTTRTKNTDKTSFDKVP